MINLLPDERKRDLRAARTNVLLLRYNLLTVGFLVILVVLGIGTYIILRENQQSALATIEENSKKTSSLANVRTAADEYRKNLAIASQIIDKGTSYTDIMNAITKLMPKGAVLEGITLDEAATSDQLPFQARAKDNAAAEELKRNLQSSPLFTNVFFQSVSQEEVDNNYPIAVSISVKFNPKAKVTP